MDTSRTVVYSPADEFLFEISVNDLMACEEYEEVNGQHYLEIMTSVPLRKEQRILTFDDMGTVREYVVLVEDVGHANGERPYGTYKCPWSLQHDAALWTVSRMVGTQNPVAAAQALDAALSGTTRWVRGTVTQTTSAGASMYQMSGWEAMSVLVNVWGGELGVEIEVGPDKVVSRRVCLYSKIGEQTAKRRFDYAKDMSGVRRNVGDSVVACRIIPRGKGEQVGNGYGRKITIEDVNDGVEWLQNDESAELFRLPDGNGGYEYPTVYADNPDIEDKQELKDWGLSVLNQYTTPQVTYSIDVVQTGIAGKDMHGISLGDAIQCVDAEFGDTPLRIEARVLSVKRDRLNPSQIELTIGNAVARSSIGSSMSKMIGEVRTLNNRSVSTAEFLNALIENINAQINATGGYWYAVRGQGTRTYDTAVSDPLVGEEASKVVEVRGGSIRIADSRTAQGEWDWRSVFQAGRVATDMVVGGHMVTGWLQSPNGNVRIDLDNGIMELGHGATMGGDDLADLINDAARYATDYIRIEQGVGISIGSNEAEIRNVMAYDHQAYVTPAGEVSRYGLNDEGVWEMLIDNISVRDMMRFGNYAWIRRDNGNMTLKWIGG